MSSKLRANPRPHPWVALPLLASLVAGCGSRAGDAGTVFTNADPTPVDGGVGGASDTASEPARAHGVVLVVWEGLRADAIDPARTPNAAAIARDGVTFAKHHAAFPSRAMVNAAVLSTGRSPASTAILGDVVMSSARAPTSLRTPDVARGFAPPGPSLFEAAQRSGVATATLGSDGAAALFDVARVGVVVDGVSAWPASMAAAIARKSALEGVPAPIATLDDGVTPDPSVGVGQGVADVDRGLVSAWSDVVLPGSAPRLSVLWLRATARAEETYGPGSPATAAALAADDALVGAIRARVDETDGDLFVVSSNGASTVAGPSALFPARATEHGRPAGIDANGWSVSGDVRFATLLGESGIDALDGRACTDDPVLTGIRADGSALVPVRVDDGSVCGHAGTRFTSGDFRATNLGVVVASNGSGELVYVRDHDPSVVARIVAAAQRRGEIGAIFVAKRHAPVAGALVLDEVFAEGGDAGPDVVVTYASDDVAVVARARGTSFAGSADQRGTAGGGATVELGVPMMAVGRHLRRGFVDALPTGNVDVATTIASILGASLEVNDGRVLDEALLGGSIDGHRAYGATVTSPPAGVTDARDPAGDADPRTTFSTQIVVDAVDRGAKTFQYVATTRALRQ